VRPSLALQQARVGLPPQPGGIEGCPTVGVELPSNNPPVLNGDYFGRWLVGLDPTALSRADPTAGCVKDHPRMEERDRGFFLAAIPGTEDLPHDLDVPLRHGLLP
jgi:hypothetical protein